ncbi:HU-CCDC81 and SPOR domain-containing protein [Tenacibaculum sp. S7007]|uniref:HU-CCDC81 and SPOR domain-containing protein n=1 Tax=Tenacibaculum pelagium TaxID=2759527 RepID=A0A839AQH1_9FLAO|nr:SPOR domain-containing protein [Tenacibaculum pelagium]MBA6156756.1 HU-CCDC81 and SPOR domain-containing protein [Tenacibaculum pelagium]
MTLANYINDLLYRYDCVIVPNFGGFVTNKIGAKVNNFTHTFYPPKKQITFNAYLKHNDGLLANYIASNKNISFEEATNFIAEEVATWTKELETKSIEVDSVGSLSLNEEQQIVFEPNASSNFLAESYGLTEVESPAVKRFKGEVKPLPIVSEEKESTIPVFFKRAAVAAVLVGVAYVGWNGFQNQQQKELLANQEEAVQKKIQSATFVIDNPLPTINLNVTKEAVKNFHIIAGAFQEVENAEKKLAELQEQGYDAKIIGKNNFGLTQVSFTSFSTKEEARKELEQIQQTVSEDAWLLVK